MSLIKNKNNSGFTIIEALVFLFIFTVVTYTFYQLFTLGINYIIESKNKLGAIALANEKMEIIHNLNYDDIGTVSGIPQGDLLEEETVVKNTRTYYVFTSVEFVDDPYDGTEDGSPDDIIPNDYKSVRVKVAWENNISSSKSVTFATNIAPPIMEENIPGTGTLSISVSDSNGQKVTGANVHVKNTPADIDFNQSTDSNGKVSRPATPATPDDPYEPYDPNKYYLIEVSKSGYYPYLGVIKTYPSYPTSAFDPVYTHSSVVEGTLNQKSITIDKTSNITINTKNPFGTSIPNIDFNIDGGRLLGYTVTSPPVAVYDYSESISTDSDGKKELTGRSSGLYTFAYSGSDYQFLKVDPNESSNNQFGVLPDTQPQINAIFADKNLNSLFVTVLDKNDSSIIKDATVELKNVSLDYDVTLTSDKYGQVYFPNALPELNSSVTYDLKVTATGYDEDNLTVNNIDNLVSKEIKLTPS